MKTQHNIYLGLEIVSIIIGIAIIIASCVPAILAVSCGVTFNFDVADLFLFGFFAGAAIMVGGGLLFDYLDKE